MNGQIGAYHLAQSPELYTPARSNNFEFIVHDINGIMKATAAEGDENSTIANAEEIIRLSVNKTKVPHFSQKSVEIKRGNSTIKFAGVPEFPSGSLEVNDYIGADTKSVLMAWQNLSYNVKTEKVGNAKNYKKQCKLIEYTPDFVYIRSWVLDGCWISNLEEGDFSNEDGEKRAITATIEYDRAYMDVD